MEQSNFSKLLNVMKVAYPYYFKELGEEDSVNFLHLYYTKLKEYPYNVAAKAIDNIITTHIFMPSLAEVISECESQKKLYYMDILSTMYKDGYFKTDEEYGKATMWILAEKPIIPDWLKKDIKKYLTEDKKQQIETKESSND